MKLVQLKLQFHSLYDYNETNFITWDIYMDLVTIKGNDASAPPKSAYLDGAIIPGRLPNLSIFRWGYNTRAMMGILLSCRHTPTGNIIFDDQVIPSKNHVMCKKIV